MSKGIIMNGAIIGTSSITHHHINSLRKNKAKALILCSTRKNSKNLPLLVKKFSLKNTSLTLTGGFNLIEKNLQNIDFFLLSGRFKDNKKILKRILKYKKKIFIEKPVFLNSRDFRFLKKFRKYIFVGYNRTKFKNITYLKRLVKNKKKIRCIVKIPEKNKKLFFFNSCHIISVLFFLFGKLKIKFRSRDKKFIILTNNKIEANLYINFGNSDNFSLEIFSNKERYLLKPLEQLKIFRKLEKETIGINNIYNPKIFKKLRENLKSKYKPGFNKQTKDFLKFVRKDILPKENSLNLAKEIIIISERIFV